MYGKGRLDHHCSYFVFRHSLRLRASARVLLSPIGEYVNSYKNITSYFISLFHFRSDTMTIQVKVLNIMAKMLIRATVCPK